MIISDKIVEVADSQTRFIPLPDPDAKRIALWVNNQVNRTSACTLLTYDEALELCSIIREVADKLLLPKGDK